jgi:hypothetical protein
MLLLFLWQTLLATENVTDQTSMILPLNDVSKIKTSLRVNIPDNFRPLQTVEQGYKNQMFEYVPKSDNENKWTQIITLNLFVGIKKSASDFTSIMKSEFNKASNAKMLEESTSEQNDYMMSSLGFSYEDKERKEVVYMRYYSGPNDLSGIQYAKPLKENQSPEELLKELKLFVDKISTVVIDQKK